MIGLETALGKTTSVLLARQRRLKPLQYDITGSLHHVLGMQSPVNLSQTRCAAHSPAFFPDILGANQVATSILNKILRLPQEFAGGSRAPDAQDVVLTALLTISTISFQIPEIEMNMTQVSPSLGQYAPAPHPLETMVTPFETLVDYCHYCVAKTTPSLTAGYLRQLTRIKRQVRELHPKPEAFAGIELVNRIRILAPFTSSRRAIGKVAGWLCPS